MGFLSFRPDCEHPTPIDMAVVRASAPGGARGAPLTTLGPFPPSGTMVPGDHGSYWLAPDSARADRPPKRRRYRSVTHSVVQNITASIPRARLGATTLDRVSRSN